MVRRVIILGAAAIVLPVAAVQAAAVGTAQARPLPVTGTGATTCSTGWSGAISFSPALMTGGTATSVSAHLSAQFKPCSGGTPPPKKGKITESFSMSTNDCTTLFPTPPSTTAYTTTASGTVFWNSPIAPSTVTSSTFKIKTVTTVISFVFPAQTVGGSYAPAGTFKVRIASSYLTVTGTTAGNCGGTGGVSSLAITPTGSSGTF